MTRDLPDGTRIRIVSWFGRTMRGGDVTVYTCRVVETGEVTWHAQRAHYGLDEFTTGDVCIVRIVKVRVPHGTCPVAFLHPVLRRVA
jgi:hypothetical protein